MIRVKSLTYLDTIIFDGGSHFVVPDEIDGKGGCSTSVKTFTFVTSKHSGELRNSLGNGKNMVVS